MSYVTHTLTFLIGGFIGAAAMVFWEAFNAGMAAAAEHDEDEEESPW